MVKPPQIAATVAALIGVAIIVVYFAVTYRSDFKTLGEKSFQSITSHSFRNYVMVCLGGSASMWFNTVSDCYGKYILKDAVDEKYRYEFILIFSILVPSIYCICSTDPEFSAAFFWPLFHIQILLVLNSAFVFWGEKMGLKSSSTEVAMNCILCTATFTMRLFCNSASWTANSTNACNIAYMVLFLLSATWIVWSARKTFNKNRKGRNLVVLIDTAAAEQQWALLTISTVLVYYLVFVVFEAVAFPSSETERYNLSVRYVGANYVLLSITALVVLILRQRRDLYQGIVAQVTF